MAYTVDAGGAWVDRGGGKGPQHYNRGQGGSKLPSDKFSTKPTNSGGSGGAPAPAPSQPSGPSYWDMMAEIQARQQAARDRAFRAGAEQQKKNLEYSTGQVNDAADKALQEAYINKMMTLKNLPQTLSAQGLTGGVAESTTAGLYNNYGNSRNEIESERLDQIGALQQAYNNNMAQLEAQRASGAAASLSEYAPVLAQLAANNPVQLVSMQQGASGATSGARLVWDEDLGQWVYR